MSPSRPQVPLPEFCQWPAVTALFVVAALTALVVWLAGAAPHAVGRLSLGMLFTLWLALVAAVLLCKLRPLFARLPGHLPYAAMWVLILAIVYLASEMAWWYDQALRMGVIPGTRLAFVRDNTLIAALLGAALLRYFHVLALWQARLRAVSEARVEALQARIRPHFLFNSMNIIASLIPVDPDGAERAVEDLSALFRASLREGATTVPLGEEIELCERYLRLEQLRLGPRLVIERDIGALPERLRIPPLSVQPLLENAVYHGVQPRPEGGCVRLAVRCEPRVLRIEVSNPLPAEPARDRNGAGMALANIRDRLAVIYGDRASLETGSVAGGFVARLAIPLEGSA